MRKKYEKSCGIIVFKKENEKNYILLIHHNLGHWTIPKGHMEKKETEKETAIREVLEETGIKAIIHSDFKKSITYSPRKDILKEAIYFIGSPCNDKIKPQLSEVQEVKWIEQEKGIQFITYENERELLKKAISYRQI